MTETQEFWIGMAVIAYSMFLVIIGYLYGGQR